MLRTLTRLLAFISLAFGFGVGLVDGTRMLASANPALSSFGEMLQSLLPGPAASLQSVLAGLHPVIWDPVTTTFMRLPAAGLFFLCGVALLLLARERRPDLRVS